MTHFTTARGEGDVKIVNGDPWVAWRNEGEWVIKDYKARVTASAGSRDGIVWKIYVSPSAPGEHNVTVNVPSAAIRAAYDQIEEDRL